MNRLKSRSQILAFKLYGYSPEDYYNHRTTVFPSIYSDQDKGWSFWSGASNVQFVLNKDKKPKKLDRPIRFTLSKLVQVEKLLVRN